MSTMTKRSTIYFDPTLRRALRVKAAETSCSVSELVNDAVRENMSEDAEDLAWVPKRDVVRVMERIVALADDPRPPEYEKLSSRERYRVRQGKYRIIYSVQDEQLTVWVVKVEHRRDVYR